MSPQNKCFRYWPDKGGTKEYGCISVRNVSEREAQGYFLRELEILRIDRVSPLLLSARRAGSGLGLEPQGGTCSFSGWLGFCLGFFF